MVNVKIKKPVTAVIFDLNNTVIYNSFVEKQLMPYFKIAQKAYFEANWSKEECQTDLKALAAVASEDPNAPKVDLTAPKQAQIDAVNKYVEYCITNGKDNSKAYIMYRFHVWFDGYERGKITTPVYFDAAVHLQKWVSELNLKVFSLSNNPVDATEKFVQKTSHGNLSALFTEHFNTTLGQLTSPETYRKLIAKTNDDPTSTVFLTKSAEEAMAAKTAGLQVVLVLKNLDKANDVADKVNDIPIVCNFAQIEFVGSQFQVKHLIATEGESAKNVIIACIDHNELLGYDVLPLGGTFPNVRSKLDKENAQHPIIKPLIEKLGLIFGIKYNTDDEKKTLNYDSLILCFDPDSDGVIMCGLVLNLFHYYWPALLATGFIKEIKMPPITLRNSNEPIVEYFYDKGEYEEWMTNKEPSLNLELETREHYNLGNYKIDEATSLLLFLKPITFTTSHRDVDLFEKAYSSLLVKERKSWLQTEMRKHLNHEDEYFGGYTKTTTHVSINDFFSNELLHAFIVVIERCIPSIIYGVKPNYRSIIEFGLSLPEGDQRRVCDYAGEMAARSSYHHALVAVEKSITKIVQNANGNMNILEAIGFFGYQGIKPAKARYISTRVTTLGRHLFNNNLPSILPVFMINGIKGCAYGWKVSIPCYNVIDLINNTCKRLEEKEIEPFTPNYQNHSGKLIKRSAKGDYISFGVIEQTSSTEVLIKELPVDQTVENYREEVLKPMFRQKKIISFERIKSNSDCFKVKLSKETMRAVRRNGIHTCFELASYFKSHLVFIDLNGVIKEFDTTEDMFNEWFDSTFQYFCKHFKSDSTAKEEWLKLLNLLKLELQQ